MAILRRKPTLSFAQPGNRSGLSLLELLLVLGIIGAVVSFAVPALLDANDLRELESDAELIVEGIAEGRAKAIESGLVYQFRFESGGNKFIIVPDPNELSEADKESGSVKVWGNLGEQMELRKELEDAGPGEQLDSEWFEGMKDAGELAGAQWSDPVEFSFEGTAEDSFFYLLDEQQRSIRIRIRGLTGAVSVSRVSFEIAEQ